MSLTQSFEEATTSYERRLMEKDRAFFDLAKNMKIIENQREVNENRIKAQDCEILNLKNELSSLQSTLKIKDNNLEAKDEKMKKLIQQFKAREDELTSVNLSKEKKLNEITNAFNSQMREYETMLAETRKIEVQNNKISSDSIDKDGVIKSLHSIIFDLKKENKQIYTLNKVLSEKEEKLNYLNHQKEQLLSKNNDLQIEINELGNRLSNLPSAGHSPMKYHVRNNNNGALNEKILNDLQNNFKNQLEQKDKYYNDLNSNYKLALKENEKLIQFTVSQIKQIEKSLDITMTYNVTTTNTIESIVEKGNSININGNNLKYDLIGKNFDLISKKIFDKLSSDYLVVEQYQNEINDFEERSKELLIANDKLRQDKTSMEGYVNKINAELNGKRKELEDMEKKNDELFRRCNAIEEILNESNEKYSFLENETNEFCNKCLSIIQEFLSNDPSLNFNFNDNIKLKEDKILDSFNIITKALVKKNSNEVEYIKDAELCNEKMKKLSEAYDQLNQQYEDNKVSSISKEEEYKKQKGVLMNKMNELSGLLEDSNNMINKYEEENGLLKTKVINIERNLQMLTSSHTDMEKMIENNTSYSNEILKQKEQKINSLLREVELKDIQIKSLEKLINELKSPRTEDNLFQMKQMKGKLLSKSQYRSLLTKKNNEDSFQFVRNEQNEKDLKNLFNQTPAENSNRSEGQLSKNLNDSINLTNNLNIENEDPKGKNSFHTAPINNNGFNPKNNPYNQFD